MIKQKAESMRKMRKKRSKIMKRNSLLRLAPAETPVSINISTGSPERYLPQIADSRTTGHVKALSFAFGGLEKGLYNDLS